MINHNLLYKILSQTNIYTIQNMSLVCKTYRYLKDVTLCKKCNYIHDMMNGIFYYPFCDQYFRLNDVKNRKINIKQIIFYCNKCFFDLSIKNVSKFKCANCQCYDNYKGISPTINIRRNMIYGNSSLGNYHFYPQKGHHDHLKYKDSICIYCLVNFESQSIVKKISMKEENIINCTCTLCHTIYDSDKLNGDKLFLAKVIDNNIFSNGYLIYKFNENYNLPLDTVICSKCIEQKKYEYKKYKYFTCDLCNENFAPLFDLVHKQCKGLSSIITERDIVCNYGSKYESNIYRYTLHSNYIKPDILDNCDSICDKCINYLLHNDLIYYYSCTIVS